MDKNKEKNVKQARRHARVRAKIQGSAVCPRLSVYRSNKGMFLQLIDDVSGKTLASAGLKEVKITDSDKKSDTPTGKQAVSKELGKLIAKKGLDKKISKVVFDRSSYKYHGRVKAAAEGAREGGLKF
ncbi:50S ribosomal protein L18 [Candidatus Falkowbacteria bacterium]|uniref:Large ribosomal subunit protein uL18 n=1 Tax=Candidatus Falkowbacteria bacterium CG10_big_fil_rev_8_21_14_0_10_37_18 TaxID=1974562 RepID=A0A2H0V8T7_9BACT|nr:50S ribosomal protein L18 [Candidatus Falkowbacteria bacterium]NCQ12530.1 50S ribosomal protein L18 [Candidatus Falkowbacteria bacterium]OIO05995.1 MAG: 50S ribosomal protein L18 [Candidatus Falkowbacteria bacterium CG1_02_37_21]PIR95516.1 MAG: 50S ribosomal protein L18 [Candidatus Falkowbacteria bacterium CG10_big_fil_rev_8_21_14_0_10_37_18]